MELSTAEQRLAKAFGDGIRNRRKKLGYTQEKLASMIGSNRRFISELESAEEPKEIIAIDDLTDGNAVAAIGLPVAADKFRGAIYHSALKKGT